MFNKSLNPLKKAPIFFLMALTILACNEEVKLKFENQHIDKSSDAKISINYPKAIGTKDVSKKINDKIEHVIANEMNMADTPENDISLSDAVSQFNQEYKSFKEDFDDSSQKWEVKVDGEVAYESADVICVSLQTYIDTGGAHGNGKVTYLNFDPQTGALLSNKDLINDMAEFKKISKKAFKAQKEPQDKDETTEDFFFGEEFQLPANIGFSEAGLVLLYNNYEIASYAQGITKIILPYNDIKDQLRVTP